MGAGGGGVELYILKQRSLPLVTIYKPMRVLKGCNRESKKRNNINNRSTFSGKRQRILDSFFFYPLLNPPNSIVPVVIFLYHRRPPRRIWVGCGQRGCDRLEGRVKGITVWACSDRVLCTFASSVEAYPAGRSCTAVLGPDICSTATKQRTFLTIVFFASFMHHDHYPALHLTLVSSIP